MQEEEVLFPAKQVQVLSGKYVTVRPWGMETGRLVSPRVAELIEDLKGNYSVKGVASLVRDKQTEVYEIIRETLGWTDEQMAGLAYEDLFTLAQAVIDVCILRGEDQGGALGKLLSLAGWTPAPAPAPKTSDPAGESDSPRPSSSS